MTQITTNVLFFLIILKTWTSTTSAHDIFNTLTVDKTSIQNDIFFEIIEPPELQYTYKIKPAKNFGGNFNANFFEKKIGLVPVEPLNGCHYPTNADQLRGKVALIERGKCSFFLKTIFAEEAGAKAAIIFDEFPVTMEETRDSPMWFDHFYIEMVTDDTMDDSKTINIPAGFLHGKNGRMILKTLQELQLSSALIKIPVNATYLNFNDVPQPPWISW